MAKSYAEINEKIAQGEAVVLTAEEVTKMAEILSFEEIAEAVDVVTTATFGAMCSSGVFINFGHTDPPIRMSEVLLNDVEAYSGIAAVDAYLGATEVSKSNEKYGGAHVIEDLINGKEIKLVARGTGTDCYPLKKVETYINKNSVNELIMHNPRNAYQNYPAVTNSTKKTCYTYMGNLLPKFGNITYSTSGELSPLLNDPEMRTIGLGTRIFLGGATGYITWHGTQFNNTKPKNDYDIPLSNGATITVTGDMKEMSSEFIRAVYYEKYGISMMVGIGVPIPILDADMAKRVSIANKNIETTIFDYGVAGHPSVGRTNYEALQSGMIEINGKKIHTAPMASLNKARKIAALLKEQIQKGTFQLTEPVAIFPKGCSLKNLDIRGESK